MKTLRFLTPVVGIVLPYLARFLHSEAWLRQYTNPGWGGFVMIEAFNAVAWVAILALSFLFRRPAPFLIPWIAGFAFLGWAHYTLDLAADAQAALALFIIPFLALLPIAVGGAIGYALDRSLRRQNQNA